MAALPLLDIRTADEWRAWLERHHAASDGIWLVFYKAHTGVASIAYHDALDQALCFGWIDSLIKRVDDRRYARKFTPRKATSKWSDVNRRKWKKLRERGELAAAGLKAAPTANSYGPRPRIPVLPGYIREAFRTNAEAWAFFQSLPATERRNFVVWIHTAKREETRERRITESVELLVSKQKLGLR